MSKVLVEESNLSNIASAIRSKVGGSTLYKPSEMAAAIGTIDTGGITPTGTVNISQNGTVDVTQYASAAVNVPNSYAASDEGKVVSNGALVAQTARASEITENGTYDTTLNNSIVVNVSGGGGGGTLQIKNAISNGVISPDSGYDGLSAVIVNIPQLTMSQFDSPIIPIMTSNTTPKGVASCSSYYDSQMNAFYAFDRINTNSWMQYGWLPDSSDVKPWLKYQFDKPEKLSAIEIYTASNNGTTIEDDVYIEGSNDDENWENILLGSNTAHLVFLARTWSTTTSNQMHFNFILNSNTYRYFRIRYPKNNFPGTLDYVQVYNNIEAGIGYYGDNVPDNMLGNDGCKYFRTEDGIINSYTKVNGVWVAD